MNSICDSHKTFERWIWVTHFVIWCEFRKIGTVKIIEVLEFALKIGQLKSFSNFVVEVVAGFLMAGDVEILR
jgi:hypothetical protein